MKKTLLTTALLICAIATTRAQHVGYTKQEIANSLEDVNYSSFTESDEKLIIRFDDSEAHYFFNENSGICIEYRFYANTNEVYTRVLKLVNKNYSAVISNTKWYGITREIYPVEITCHRTPKSTYCFTWKFR